MHKPRVTSHKWIEPIALPFLLIFTTHVVSAGQNQQPQHSGDERKGAPEWLKFSPEGAPFSLLMPASPTEKTKDEDSGMKAHRYKLKAGANEYQVVWFANVPYVMLQRAPLNVLFPRGLEEILKSARQAGKKGLLTTHEEDVTFKGYHGRESTMESDSASIQAKGFIAGHDFITLAVLHPKEESATADAKRFLDSLMLPDLRLASSTQGSATPRAGTAASPSNQVDTRPIPLNHPRPNYTDLARNNRVQGMVRIRALIGADGIVKDVRFLSHLPDGLDEEAAKAVLHMQFKPATKAGQPVAVWQILEVEFNLGQRQ